MSSALETITPGEILLEEFLKPYGISQNRLSGDIDIPTSRVSEIINGQRSITADTALRLAVYFKTTPEFWLNLQMAYDLEVAQQASWEKAKLRIRPLEHSAA